MNLKYFEKVRMTARTLKRFLLIMFFSLVAQACSTNTTKSGEMQDNETRNEINDNSSAHVYLIDSPIRMSHEEIGEVRFAWQGNTQWRESLKGNGTSTGGRSLLRSH